MPSDSLWMGIELFQRCYFSRVQMLLSHVPCKLFEWGAMTIFRKLTWEVELCLFAYFWDWILITVFLLPNTPIHPSLIFKLTLSTSTVIVYINVFVYTWHPFNINCYCVYLCICIHIYVFPNITCWNHMFLICMFPGLTICPLACSFLGKTKAPTLRFTHLPIVPWVGMRSCGPNYIEFATFVDIFLF